MTPAARKRVAAAIAALSAYGAACAPHVDTAATTPMAPENVDRLDYPQPASIEKPDDYSPRLPRARASRNTTRPRSRTAANGGGSTPPESIKYCESRGSYSAENTRSTASGAWQVTDGTWNGYGGYQHAADAPPAIQDERAAQLWNGGAGAHHWEACL